MILYKSRLQLIAAVTVLLWPLAVAAQGSSDTPKKQPESVVIERDVVYGDAGKRPLKLDIIRPKQRSDSPRPLIVFVHGGAWLSGKKSSAIKRLVPFAAPGDYVCATIEYRLSGEALWPAQIHDCKAAIRWLRDNSKKYNIDSQKIGVWGNSAGGHLVNMLGTSGDCKELEGKCGTPGKSSRVACVVPFCGPSDLRDATGFRDSAVGMLLGGPALEKQEAAKEASPVTYVTKDDPPFLIFHGTKDPIVPFSQAKILYAALQEAGVDATLVQIEGGGHGIGGQAVTQRVEAFFAKHLLGKKVEVSAAPIKAPKKPRRRP